MNQHVIHLMRLLVKKLEAASELSQSEEHTIEALPALQRSWPAGHDIVREGDQPDKCVLIVKGWACRYKTTAQGKRQIVSLHLPGDIPDLQSLFLPSMDHTLGALSGVEVAFIPHERLRAVSVSHPRLARALWRDTLIDASIYREWMLGLGRRNAVDQMGHLFCELHSRLDAVGMLNADHSFDLPITQADLSDALGMSLVHVSRSLQELRRTGLISWTNGRLQILDRPALAEQSDYNPAYLHLHH